MLSRHYCLLPPPRLVLRAAPTSTMSSMSTSPSTVERARGAIIGALVADAATMPLHWIYDQSKLHQMLVSKGKDSAPEFFDPPSCPFYTIPLGSLSPYGAELHAMLRFLAQPERLESSRPRHASLDGAQWAAALGRHFSEVYSGYKNKSVKTVVANLALGKTYPETGDSSDSQANSLCKLPAVVAVYAGSDALPAAVEAAVRAQQNNDASVTLGLAAARILEKVVLGSSVEDALTWATAEGSLPPAARDVVAAAVAAKGEPFLAAAQRFGVSCSMPGALQGALAAALAAKSYSEGVRLNAVAGGDNCSRSVYLGALLGAAYGADAVPQDWRNKVTGWTEMEADVTALLP